ncbi:MAG: helix-turn-helix domain-containing protein [Clostridiales bacterium]|nr:helix-turn-helix domain-containing protein [Clostridiales bacterium]
MEEAKVIGNKLKDARKAAGLTQKQVAEIMLMTQQQYSRFENGKFELNYGQVIKLCKLFNISASDLFGV